MGVRRAEQGHLFFWLLYGCIKSSLCSTAVFIVRVDIKKGEQRLKSTVVLFALWAVQWPVLTPGVYYAALVPSCFMFWSHGLPDGLGKQTITCLIHSAPCNICSNLCTSADLSHGEIFTSSHLRMTGWGPWPIMSAALGNSELRYYGRLCLAF